VLTRYFAAFRFAVVVHPVPLQGGRRHGQQQGRQVDATAAAAYLLTDPRGKPAREGKAIDFLQSPVHFSTLVVGHPRQFGLDLLYGEGADGHLDADAHMVNGGRLPWRSLQGIGLNQAAVAQLTADDDVLVVTFVGGDLDAAALDFGVLVDF